MLKFYEKHNLASKLFLLNKETQVEIFFESVLGKLKCDCQCLQWSVIGHGNGRKVIPAKMVRLAESQSLE